MARKVTLQTIAEHLGVSRTTVSNAYNRPDQLAPELRERVLATAAELGYTGPDPAARRLRSGGREAIGLLFTESLAYAFDDPAAVLFLQGFARADRGGRARDADPPGLAPAHRGDEDRAAVREAVVGGFCAYSLPGRRPRPGRRDRARGCRSWSSTSRGRASTRSSASTTARAPGWPPSTSPRSATGGSASSPSAPPTTTTPAR